MVRWSGMAAALIPAQGATSPKQGMTSNPVFLYAALGFPSSTNPATGKSPRGPGPFLHTRRSWSPTIDLPCRRRREPNGGNSCHGRPPLVIRRACTRQKSAAHATYRLIAASRVEL